MTGARNVISGNGQDGVQIFSSDNAVQGNFIGIDATGTVALANGANGLWLLGHDNTIGGAVAGARNVISGNALDGILIGTNGLHGQHNTVQGNLIGTKADGTGDLGNIGTGVNIVNGPNCLIGGPTSGSANVISGNGGNGVRIGGGFATGNQVQGNVIRSNDLQGVRVEFGPNTIGGGNIIFQNGDNGIRVSPTAPGVRIFANQVFANGTLGIDLSGGTQDAFGVTANDTDDPDTGANDLQNFPVLTAAVRSNATAVTTVSGTLNSNPSTQFTIELYLTALDPSGHGEAQMLIGSKTVTTNAGGDIGFSFVSTIVVPGHVLTATATSTTAGNTSEFALNRTVVSGP